LATLRMADIGGAEPVHGWLLVEAPLIYYAKAVCRCSFWFGVS
jgi:hypothetical protein